MHSRTMISGFCFALRGNVAYCDTFYMVCIILLDRVYCCYRIRCPENILLFFFFFVSRSMCSSNFLPGFPFLSLVLEMRWASFLALVRVEFSLEIHSFS